MADSGSGSSPPEHAGPPDAVLEKIPDRAAVKQFVADRSPPFHVGYKRGREVVDEEFATVATERGGEIVELHYPDGRYVTVDASTELEHIAEATTEATN